MAHHSHEYEKFHALSPEKQTLIINTAMAEFVRGGYEKASMNTIVEKAGISKGSLFFYFKNKKQLFLYLFHLCEEMVVDNTTASLENDTRDFLDRMKRIMRGNVNLIKQHPLVFAFMRTAKSENALEVVAEVAALTNTASEAVFKSVYSAIDETLFKPEIDIPMAVFTVKATLFQLIHDFLRSGETQTDELLSRIDAQILFFKALFYTH